MSEVLREQQLDVSADCAGHDRVGNERPDQVVTMQFDQTGLDRVGHPLVKIWMPRKERVCRCPPLEPIGPLATESKVVIDELGEQLASF